MNRITEPVFISPTECISRREWCIRMAEEFTKKYSEEGFIYLPGNIQKMVDVCRSGDDLPEDSPKEDYEIIESICQLLEQSKQWEAAHTAPETPAEGPLTEEPAPECVPVILEAPAPMELQIVNAAKSASKASYTELRDLFDFGDNLAYVKVKDGAIVTPADWGKVWGFAADWTYSAGWVMADAAAHLEALGFVDSLTQLAADFKLAKSTAYNYCRVARRVPCNSEARKSLPLTTCVEIAAGRYDDDEKKNQEVIDELLQSAINDGWNASEARSHARMRKGKDDPVEGRPSLREQLSAQDRRIMFLEETFREILIAAEEGLKVLREDMRADDLTSIAQQARNALGIADQEPQQEAA